jgi:type II secretory pathway component GspD/PulD (secretin)
MSKIKLFIGIGILFITTAALEGQEITVMDFRNQNISDILMILADIGQQSVIIDETVGGTATFHFNNSSYEDALYRFTDACNLYVEKKNNAYYISKIKIAEKNGLISIDTEDVAIELLVKSLSRAIGKTIIYDSLPRTNISLHSHDSNILDLLKVIIIRYPDYTIVEENDAFYLRHTANANANAYSRLDNSAITKNGDFFSMNVQRGTLSSIISMLFRVGEKEYSMLQRIDMSLENLYFKDKSFDDLLHIILEQGNCDYTKSSDIYYIFEVQRRDILKKLKDVIVIQLQYFPVEEALALLPTDYSGASFLKSNKNTNSVYLTGSTEEIQPIADFLAMLDVPIDDNEFVRFEIHYLKVGDFIALLPRELLAVNPLVIPGTNAFVAQITKEVRHQFEKFIRLTDILSVGIPIHLKYINSSELIQNLPPSVAKEEIVLSTDPTLIFYKGTEEKQKQFMEHLYLIDKPKPQIRYQLLVIQYQRSDNVTWNKSLSLNDLGVESSPLISGTFFNLLNIKFDIISEMGFQFAAQLNWQIGEDKAKVLADTTLNGISDQEIKFENTNTFRYRDTTIDPETGKPFYTGTTREITSGLLLNINGWVSGDGMITMHVNAAVSKQNESGQNTSVTTNPPPTSSRVVNTQVRTKSGTPIVIGGLLQVEKNSSVQKIPGLGNIPLIGKFFQNIDTSEITTEMVIYIVPFVHNSEAIAVDYVKQYDRYFNKYIYNKE